jgi:hypothetical protein
MTKISNKAQGIRRKEKITGMLGGYKAGMLLKADFSKSPFD